MSDQNNPQGNLNPLDSSNATPSDSTASTSAADAMNKAAADAAAAAENLRRLMKEQASQQANQAEEVAQSTADEEFVGSGGVGSQEQLDAIRRGYAERGIEDPSGLGMGNNNDSEA